MSYSHRLSTILSTWSRPWFERSVAHRPLAYSTSCHVLLYRSRRPTSSPLHFSSGPRLLVGLGLSSCTAFWCRLYMTYIVYTLVLPSSPKHTPTHKSSPRDEQRIDTLLELYYN
jgi:hypothetical protein